MYQRNNKIIALAKQQAAIKGLYYEKEDDFSSDTDEYEESSSSADEAHSNDEDNNRKREDNKEKRKKFSDLSKLPLIQALHMGCALNKNKDNARTGQSKPVLESMKKRLKTKLNRNKSNMTKNLFNKKSEELICEPLTYEFDNHLKSNPTVIDNMTELLSDMDELQNKACVQLVEKQNRNVSTLSFCDYDDDYQLTSLGALSPNLLVNNCQFDADNAQSEVSDSQLVLVSNNEQQSGSSEQGNVQSEVAEFQLVSNNGQLSGSSLSMNSNNNCDKQKILVKSNVYDSPFIILNKYKKTTCVFCNAEVSSVNFSRHLKRKHSDEREVKTIFAESNKSKKIIRQEITLIRNQGNLDSALMGHIIPKKQKQNEKIPASELEICKYCNGFHKKNSLRRHMNTCFAKPENEQCNASDSMIYRMSLMKYTSYLLKLDVTNAVFKTMKADKITEEALSDPLVAEFGERLFQSKKKNRSLYVISNRIRECGRFLIQLKVVKNIPDMLTIMKANNYDLCLNTVRTIAKFDPVSRSFGVPSLALHFGVTLTGLAALAKRLIFQNKFPTRAVIPDDEAARKRLVKEFTEELDQFHFIVKTQWHGDIGSLALKDLGEKKRKRPMLIPLTEDVMKLKKCLENEAEIAYKKLTNKITKRDYITLAEVTLAYTITHNRKRPGDVHHLDLTSYKEQIDADQAQNTKEFETSLTPSERILTSQYRRIVATGKLSHDAVILLPKKLQKYYTKIYDIRKKQHWFKPSNDFFFCHPEGEKWMQGYDALRKYANRCGAKKPELLTATRLRKHVATVTQVLNLQRNEIDQIANFLGHTTKTHEDFYKWPDNVYQVAKISKLLQLIDSGETAKFANKSLEQIDIDMDTLCESDTNDINGEIENQDVDDPDYMTPMDVDHDSENAELTSKNKKTNNKEKSTDYLEVPKGKVRWNHVQSNLVKQYFKNHIKNKICAKKNECEELIRQNPEIFKNLDWVRIKTYVYNQYK